MKKLVRVYHPSWTNNVEHISLQKSINALKRSSPSCKITGLKL